MDTLDNNLQDIRGRIARVADAAGRSADEICLVGVTKYVGIELAARLHAAGCQQLGESRPQELWKKAAAIPAASWHLVGHLQRNKIRRTLPMVGLIHSVDSLRLLTAIEEEAARINRHVSVLLEVNTSGDEAKHGLSAEDLPAVLNAAGDLTYVQIRGLMTMAARAGGADVARHNFATLRNLRDRLVDQAPPNVRLQELSMGMSGDFEAAIAEGATLVRVGSQLWKGVDGAD